MLFVIDEDLFIGESAMLKRVCLALMVFAFVAPFTLSAEQNWENPEPQTQPSHADGAHEMSSNQNESADYDADFKPEEAPESSEEYEEPTIH